MVSNAESSACAALLALQQKKVCYGFWYTFSTLQSAWLETTHVKQMQRPPDIFFTYMQYLGFSRLSRVQYIIFKLSPNRTDLSFCGFKRYKSVLRGRCEMTSPAKSRLPFWSFKFQHMVGFDSRKHPLVNQFKPFIECHLFVSIEFALLAALPTMCSALLSVVPAIVYFKE